MKQFTQNFLWSALFFSIGFLIASRYCRSYCSVLYPHISMAIAVIYPTQGNNVHGVVYFTQQEAGVHITATIGGLTPGEHGFHIHEFGNCACSDAVCAGDHFNPTGKPHAGPTDPQRHMGDLGNIMADAQGNATYDFLDDQLSLNGPYSIIGRTLIIHAQKDDFTSQPSGNAGARIGCGVIGIKT